MMLVNIIQYRGTVRIFNYRIFVKESSIIKVSLNFYNNFHIDSALVLCNNGSFWLLLFSVLLLLKRCVSGSAKYRGASIFVIILVQIWVGVWLCTCMMSLSGDVQVSLGPRNKACNAFSVYKDCCCSVPLTYLNYDESHRKYEKRKALIKFLKIKKL